MSPRIEHTSNSCMFVNIDESGLLFKLAKTESFQQNKMCLITKFIQRANFISNNDNNTILFKIINKNKSNALSILAIPSLAKVYISID